MKATEGNRPSANAIWATATLFVTIVSCCSLIGVSIMPLISGPSYKVFITLFTGLAVGSLVGSAIFSLIPQAFNLTNSQDDHGYLLKALVIFCGIYLFYCSERIMRIYFERRTRNKRKKNNLVMEPLKVAENSETNEINETIENNVTVKNNLDGDLVKQTDEKDDTITVAINIPHQHHHHTHLNPHEIINSSISKKNEAAQKEIAPVAWMIIIGDGLHNFIDGLSIGAAFSESIYFGITTSVAVICEEFPHELGDFAVLISAGMTVRQALGFNFLSACTCYIGMVFGIILGDMTQSASYIFALAGGMFLYISLVDMMGELSATLDEPGQSTRETLKLLLMQNIGILTGIIIIFALSSIDSARSNKLT